MGFSPERALIPRYVPGVVGWVHLLVEELDCLAELIPPGGRFLEIGSANGASAALLAARRPDAYFLCVDTFVDDEYERDDQYQFRTRRWLLNRRPNMNLWLGTVGELLARLPGIHFDIALVDADHTYESCRADLKAANGLVRPGGIMTAHDYRCSAWPGITPAVDEFLGSSRWRLDKTVSYLAVMRENPPSK